MTERLYYADSYLTEFDAAVVAVEERRLYLDRTAFYPTSGGQQFDVGSVAPGTDAAAAASVVDVIDEGDRIAHVLSAPLATLAAGARVVGRVDWGRRFDHMQQHTGQHLLSALFREMHGLSTLSVHFGAETSTLDLDASTLSADQIRSVENRANASVFENRSVSTSIEQEGSLVELRKATERSGPIRVVSIDGLDKSACGGTHVARTAEIGPILLRGLDRVRKSVRIEFVCGGRATRRARADYDLLSELGALFATSLAAVPEAARQRLAELAEQRSALRAAREELDQYRARELYARASERDLDATRPVIAVQRVQNGSLSELRGLAQRYASLPRAVLVATTESPPAVLLAAAQSSGIDAGAMLKAALAEAGGRGGGSPQLAQGTVADGAALEAVLQSLGAKLGPLSNDKPGKLG